MNKGVLPYMIGVSAGSVSAVIHHDPRLPFGLRLGLGLLVISIFMGLATGFRGRKDRE